MKYFIAIVFLSFSQIWAAPDKDPRIIGGQPSNSGEFSFAVGVFYQKPNTAGFCGGSLISDRWVLTAAQCLSSASRVTIHLGTNDLKETIFSGLIINSTSYKIHPNYNQQTKTNDIGLILLPTAIKFTDKIQPIELASKTLGPNEETIAVGWGPTVKDGNLLSNILYQVPLSTIPNAACKQADGSQFADTIVCGSGDGSQGICREDVGSALVQVDGKGKRIHVALGIFNPDCNTMRPSGFTRTYEYTEWITAAMKPSSAGVARFAIPLIFIAVTSIITLL